MADHDLDQFERQTQADADFVDIVGFLRREVWPRVEREVLRTRDKYGPFPTDRNRAVGIATQELGELAAEVLKNTKPDGKASYRGASGRADAILTESLQLMSAIAQLIHNVSTGR